ncbi:serine/threonine-protein kinase [Actinophytocola sp. KF-1]
MGSHRVVAGRYRLDERLGSGGMGVVWRAHDVRLQRTVAVKEVLLPPALDESRLAEIRTRTMREGRIAARLDHPQLTAVYDVLEDGGRPFLVMEYLPSKSLSRVLDERGALPYREVARLGAQAAAALAAAHAAGVVHRDVKPANLLVGDDDTVKITDFGVSRVVEDVTWTTTGTFVGTPAYLAPEVAQGKEVTYASDVYSLGATLYTAVEGTPPTGTSSNPMLLLHRIASGDIVPPKQAGPLGGVLMRLLSTDPADRPTMAQAHTALAEIAEDREPTAVLPAPVPAPPPAAPAPPPPAQGGSPRRRRAAAILALAALFVVVAVATTLLVLDRDGTPPDDKAGAPVAEKTTTTSARATSARPTTTTRAQPTEETEEPSAAPPAPSSPANEQPPPAADPTASPVAAVTDYYAIMPGNPDVGWTRLSSKFQQSPANGRDYYNSYWSGITAVRASQVSGQGSTVEVTLDIAFKDGRDAHERHRYGLVNQNGRWLIDTVDVLSSTIS